MILENVNIIFNTCTGNTDSNLYTVRVYRSSPHTTGDSLAIIVASLCGSLYAKVRLLN